MKTASIALLCFVIVTVNGCAGKSDKGAFPATFPHKVYIIRSDDRRVTFETGISGGTNACDGVIVDAPRAIISALDAHIKKKSTRFSMPEEAESLIKRKKYEKSQITFLIDFSPQNKTLVFHPYFISEKPEDWAKNMKKTNQYIAAFNYPGKVELKINCSGATQHACERQLADSAMNLMAPFVDEFIAEQGY